MTDEAAMRYKKFGQAGPPAGRRGLCMHNEQIFVAGVYRCNSLS